MNNQEILNKAYLVKGEKMNKEELLKEMEEFKLMPKLALLTDDNGGYVLDIYRILNNYKRDGGMVG